MDPSSASANKRYFVRPKNEIVRLRLETQLGKMRSWAPSLKGEPEKELKQLGT